MAVNESHKKLITELGFKPKENTVGIFQKKFKSYAINVDFNKEVVDYGDKIKVESKTTQNFSQDENWVILECVNRLLEKGYNPENITLEKTWKTGHGTSGRLDILVSRENGSAYLMIECKTWGKEFEKELKNLHKNGGQLFTYFQQDKDSNVIMLYSSQLVGNNIQYRNEIIKIEEDYRQTGNVKDLFERWNKQPKTNGVFDNWTTPYEFKSKALTRNDLKVLKHADSSHIFNRFLEILRHNVVSDKPNAFNKIFTLFLCKIVDEDRNKDNQLHFQWLEGQDDHITFQKRLTDLYNRGMLELLEKKVTDVSDSEFDKQFLQVEEQYKDKFKEILTEIRLKKNNEFAIKEVYDDASFQENAKVVKEVVELLQVYQIRYNYRQQFLSDFFELLLTTGLKQESGQFFTPVPIARFIIKSLPFPEITGKKIAKGNKNDLLPTIIDFAAGSGHFITESMEEVQKHIDSLDARQFNPTAKRAIKKWKEDQFDWAEDYVYGIEKDYRLVKTAKVSCYLHGDGLAKVIHGDGLGDFLNYQQYKDLLKVTDRNYPQDNKQFDIVISNPPYSVSAFKGQMNEEQSKSAFDLYDRLTDQSSEIECLFIERTKQLLKNGGVAGIILPSSILSNTGIYTQTREIILRYFEVIAIAEMGSNTFMATGTNTVTLFLKRRNNADAFNVEEAVKKLFVNLHDVTINEIENPLQKYITHVWEDVSFDDYKTLILKSPNKRIQDHELYQEYNKKIKFKSDQEKWEKILDIEQDKLLYFILAFKQKIVLLKTGSKTKEKQFLGYEFSNRRGSEGIHPIKRSKTIDECTQLYDPSTLENTEKASTYIYNAFNGNVDLEINENLKENISYQNLVDMFTFDRVDFEKKIWLTDKKKVKIESKWFTQKLGDLCNIKGGNGFPKEYQLENDGLGVPFFKVSDMNTKANSKEMNIANFIVNKKLLIEDIKATIFDKNTIIFPKVGRAIDTNKKRILINEAAIDNNIMGISVKDEDVLNSMFLFHYFQHNVKLIDLSSSANPPSISATNLSTLKIPLPPKDIQQKLVSEIEKLEKQEEKIVEEIKGLRIKIKEYYLTPKGIKKRMDEICEMKAGKFVKSDDINKVFKEELFPCYGGNGLRGYTKTHTNDGLFSLVGRQGALCGNVHLVEGKFHATEHALVVYPNENVNKNWLHYQLVFMNLNQYATGTAQPGLSVMNLKPIEIVLPSISQQKKIVSEIKKVEAKIRTLETQIAEMPRQKKAIMDKYLKEAKQEKPLKIKGSFMDAMDAIVGED